MKVIRQSKPSLAIKHIETLLEYRLPQSGKALGSIVLARSLAEQLVREWYELKLKAETTTGSTGGHWPAAK
jgi:hypothetical protein